MATEGEEEENDYMLQPANKPDHVCQRSLIIPEGNPDHVCQRSLIIPEGNQNDRIKWETARCVADGATVCYQQERCLPVGQATGTSIK